MKLVNNRSLNFTSTVENKYNGLKDFGILVKSPLYRYKLSIVLIGLGIIVVRYLLDKDLC